jgi:hypothetical protein
MSEVQPEALVDPRSYPGAVDRRQPQSGARIRTRENYRKNTVSIDPIAFLDEITGVSRKRQLLSPEEFYRIAKRVRPPLKPSPRKIWAGGPVWGAPVQR